jgi:hypothetical protein
MSTPRTSPGPYRQDHERRHLVLDRDGVVIAVCALAGIGAARADANAALFSESFTLLQLLEEAHGEALVRAISVRMLARPGEQSEADARAAEDFANRLGAAVARAQGRV